MESPEVSQFRQYILDGMWSKAEAALMRLGVQEDEGLWVCDFSAPPPLGCPTVTDQILPGC